MNATTCNTWHPRHLGAVIVFTALFNLLLFTGLPWLTRVADRDGETRSAALHILTPRRSPKKAESEKEKRLRMEELKQAPKPKLRTTTTDRQLNKPMFGLEFGEGGFGDGIAVKFDAGAFGLDMDEFGFRLDQVDKAPRPIRRIKPVYPFTAKRRGIKARVLIRGLVDKNGNPQRVVAAECDPEDALDVFGPPAVEAFKKWRFAPGEIGGNPVPTKAAINIYFEID